MIACRNSFAISQFRVHSYSYKLHIKDETYFLEGELAKVWSYLDGTRSIEEVSKECELTSLIVLSSLKTLEKKGLIFWKNRF